MKCTNCGNEVPSDLKYCPICGAFVVNMDISDDVLARNGIYRPLPGEERRQLEDKSNKKW